MENLNKYDSDYIPYIIKWGRITGWLGVALSFGPALVLARLRLPEAVQDTAGQYVLHPSLLDAVMIISRLPNVACVMKTELMNNVFLGAGARLARYIRNIPVRRMVRRAVDDFACGSQLLLFPEGTRTTQSPLNPFKGSLGLIADHACVPVQTVFIETDSPYLGKGWPLFRKPPLPIHYRVRLGRRFDPPTNVQHFMSELADYFAQEMESTPAAKAHGMAISGGVP